MRAGFYPKLAWEGIRKNRRFYFPYLLTGCVMVMMFYILRALMDSPSLAQMKGGSVLMSVLPLGCIVIGVFSLLFLFYTNSFLIKQRYREFGLYNVLGMDKGNIRRIMRWEALFVALLALAGGLAAGLLFSKAAELVLLNLLGMNIGFDLSLSVKALGQTVLVYGAIYLLLLFNSVLRVGRSQPLELLQSSHTGERIPKRTWLFAVAGAALLAMAYWLAVSIQEPLTAAVWFFVAVVLVIVGSYLLFIAGSVAICRLLQKNKRYYYRPRHFVSVSSMVYRMKRNGAGLASICILLTMVLVMLTSTSCLYFGSEDTLYARCPYRVNISTSFDHIDGIREANLERLREVIRRYSGPEAELTGVRACEAPGLITEDGFLLDLESAGASGVSFERQGYLAAVSLEDYNLLMGEEKSLAADECMLFCSRLKLDSDSFTVEFGQRYRVKEHLTDFQVDGDTLSMAAPMVYIIVPDLEAFAAAFESLQTSAGDPLLVCDWRCGFDPAEGADEKAMADELKQALAAELAGEEKAPEFFQLDVFSRQGRRESFNDMYGSLFFLGLMLSLVFLLAAVLIIYYKQICEGYEDQARFEIMQKVGMTRRDIRQSINSQMLTVFFLPLGLAGLHLGFAFPFISRILLMFAFHNTALNIAVNVACFGAVGLFYALVYKITSGAYYRIVSNGKSG